MSPQLELSFSSPPQADLLAAEYLSAWLSDRGGWWTAKRLGAVLGIDDRRIRALTSLRPGEIISGPGCPGYKHASHCTAAELSGAAAKLERQAKNMAERAARMRVAAARAAFLSRP